MFHVKHPESLFAHDTIVNMNETKVVSEVGVTDFITNYPDWRVIGGKLVADFELQGFESAMRVVNKVAEYAKETNHHPHWSNVYNKLSFTLCTHDADDKITNLDISLATEISNIIAGGGG